MATTPSSTPPAKVPVRHRRRRAKRARVGDGSSSAADWTAHVPAHRRDWASLPSGPVWVIAERVLSRDVADYVRFRAACSAWRRCTANPQEDALDPRYHPRDWVMLEDVLSNHRNHRRFRDRYRCSRFGNVSTGEQIRMTIRGLDGRHGRTYLARTSEGLLVLLNKLTEEVYVVNPVTGARTDLPPVTEMLSNYPRGDVFPRAPMEVDFGAALADGSTVVIHLYGLLAVATKNAGRWAMVEGDDGQPIYGPLVSSAGRVYCLGGDVAMVVEISPKHPPRLTKAAHDTFA